MLIRRGMSDLGLHCLPGPIYSIGRLRCPFVIVFRHPHSSNIFFSETAWPIKVKFHMEPSWNRGTKVYSNGPGHLTKMAAMPIYGKNLKKSLLLQNQKTNDLESWYVASGARVLPSLFK